MNLDQMVQCMPGTLYLHGFIAVLSTFQAIALAWLAQRARRRDRDERNGNGKP
jgi:ABC-type Fe3+ transport system permease subunit